MNSSAKKDFEKSAVAKKRKSPAPFSIRLSADERGYLERKAGQRPLGQYIRRKLLGDEETPRNTTRAPSVDYALLGQLLGMLGKSEQVSCLFHLLAAAEADRVQLEEQERKALNEVCTDVREMRALLIRALGLRSETEA
tara:strand:- start:11889 stop:12305 length:417 start_codon:yes stop_codon:yes gene_type:complete